MSALATRPTVEDLRTELHALKAQRGAAQTRGQALDTGPAAFCERQNVSATIGNMDTQIDLLETQIEQARRRHEAAETVRARHRQLWQEAERRLTAMVSKFPTNAELTELMCLGQTVDRLGDATERSGAERAHPPMHLVHKIRVAIEERAAAQRRLLAIRAVKADVSVCTEEIAVLSQSGGQR